MGKRASGCVFVGLTSMIAFIILETFVPCGLDWCSFPISMRLSVMMSWSSL